MKHEEMIPQLVSHIKELSNDNHLLIYKFLQTHNQLQHAIMNDQGLFLNLKTLNATTFYSLFNYTSSISNLPYVYINYTPEYIFIIPK